MADQLSDPHARPYKSRTKRPCDFCRHKRAACLLAAAPPCDLCSRHGKPCTFLENPAKRRRPNSSPSSAPPLSAPANLHHASPAPDLPPAPELQSPSLDAEPDHNAQIVGLSGESDPYLLRRYRFGDNGQCCFQQLRIRDMGMADGVPVQFMVQDNSLANKAQPGDFGKSATAIRDEIIAMVANEVGKRLIKL